MMKLHKLTIYILSLCIAACFFIVSPTVCCAASAGFETVDLSEERIAEIYPRWELALIDEPDVKQGFVCFDVNPSGHYALGFGETDKKAVLVYDENGNYLYGFSFNTGSFGVGWDGNDLILYSVRGDLAICIDRQGQCLWMKDIPQTSHNSDIWRKEVEANTRVKEDATYKAEHWLYNNETLHWGIYTRLIKTLPTGEEIVLFDQTQGTILRRAIPLMFASCISLISAPIIVLCCISKKQKTGQKTNERS